MSFLLDYDDFAEPTKLSVNRSSKRKDKNIVEDYASYFGATLSLLGALISYCYLGYLIN